LSPRAYFLDTNILVAAFLIEESDARRLLDAGKKRKIRLLTNEYVLKELRFTLGKSFRVAGHMVESFILDIVAPSLLVLKQPSRQEVRSFRSKVRDRSDVAIIIPCVKHGLILVTLDSNLRRSAKELIKVISLKESIKEISGSA